MNKRSAPAVGASSLLVIFAVLCLTVFALLSLSTVQAGKRLSDAAADSVLSFYAADTRAEEIFAALRGGELPEGVTVSDELYSYTCPISDTQELRVVLSCGGGEWTVLRWQTVSTTRWTADDSLDVWDGEPIF